jgi:hypothetical protein
VLSWAVLLNCVGTDGVYCPESASAAGARLEQLLTGPELLSCKQSHMCSFRTYVTTMAHLPRLR